MVYLSELANLQRLDLRGSHVTDSGLQHLEGLASLHALYLNNTKVTAEGVKRLQQALPDCEIRH